MIALSDEYFSFDMSDTKKATGWKAQHYLGDKITIHEDNDEDFQERNKKETMEKRSLETTLKSMTLILPFR